MEGLGEAKAELVRFLSPRTVDLIVRKLPLEGRASLHQNEVFFEVVLSIGEEKAKNISDKGMIAYWPMGRALCVFLDKVRPYSAINPVGRITENLSVFSQVKSGTKIRVERV
ncbi:MAG: cyclophilin-like fold protein [Candidatus Bathyarchaeia archaeon]